MRVLIAGDWHSDLHEEEVANSLSRLGHEIGEFKWYTYFTCNSQGLINFPHLYKRVQNKFILGSIVTQINKDLIIKVRQFRPDILFVYRGTHIQALTLKHVKILFPNCTIIGYNNDDPFSPKQPTYLWRHFISAIPHHDIMLAYRHRNLSDFNSHGAKHTALLRSWYVPDRNYPLSLSTKEKKSFQSDIVFIGHYEADNRLKYLEEIIKKGYRLRIFGPPDEWNPVIKKSKYLQSLGAAKVAWGKDYNLALCGAKIALCFLSKLNRDTYTRRCFEIPATGTLLLSEYTTDLSTIFQEGIEADFFRNCEEMIKKINIYLTSDKKRTDVAAAGRKRLSLDGHDIDSRMQQMLALIR